MIAFDVTTSKTKHTTCVPKPCCLVPLTEERTINNTNNPTTHTDIQTLLHIVQQCLCVVRLALFIVFQLTLRLSISG